MSLAPLRGNDKHIKLLQKGQACLVISVHAKGQRHADMLLKSALTKTCSRTQKLASNQSLCSICVFCSQDHLQQPSGDSLACCCCCHSVFFSSGFIYHIKKWLMRSCNNKMKQTKMRVKKRCWNKAGVILVSSTFEMSMKGCCSRKEQGAGQATRVK